MNLLDSIDKSAYTLLFSNETEMNPYGTSAGSNPVHSRSFVAGSSQSHPVDQNQSGGVAPINLSSVVKPHTVLNMKTTLVNGTSYDNCDNTGKCDFDSEETDVLGRKSIVQAEVKLGISPTKNSTVELNGISTATSIAVSSSISVPNLPPPQLPTTSYNLIAPPGTINYFGSNRTSMTDQYNFGGLLGPSPSFNPSATVGPIIPQGIQPLLNGGLYGNSVPAIIAPPLTPGGAGQFNGTSTRNYWGPDNNFSSNLSTGNGGMTVNSYSEGQKILPSTYFVKDYSNIFGNIANIYETEERGGDVAKLPIKNSLHGSKMFLIGLSSTAADYDEEEEEDMLENEDQGSSNSPFQSATEEMGGDGDHERGGDQDPLLVRPPPKQNVFHHFIRSATKTTRNNRRPKRNGKQSSFGREDQGSSQDRCSSSSALIKEVQPPQDAQEDDNEDPMLAGSSSGEGARSGRRCSIGILLAAISCVFFATSALIVKISNLHPMELLAVRGLIQGILISPIVISSGNSFMGPSGSRSLLLARAVLGAVALVMAFASIHLIQLSDAATVIFTSPVFVSIFACICLGEVCSWFDVSMIALTLVGVLLVSNPSFTFLSTGTWKGIVGTICGLIAAMLTALAFIVLRQLKQVHYSVVVFWFSSVLATFGAVLTIAMDGFTLPRTWAAVMECIGIGFCGFMGQILLTKALQSENALPIAVTRTFDIVLAFFYQITLLHDTPDWYSYLGSVLVVSCVLLTAFRRWYKESITKKYQRVHKIPDDERMIDESLHESSSSPPLPIRNSSNHHKQQLHRQSSQQEEEVNFA